MQWWNEFLDWFGADETRPVLFSAAVLALAVIVAGLLAAGIASRATTRLLRHNDREQKNAAIAALVDAATEASVWNSLTPQEQVLSDRAVGQADIRVRLLPIKGAGLAANWATLQLAELKRNSATFGYQLEPAIAEFRDRLIEWQYKPARARRVFLEDLDGWQGLTTDAERTLLARQDAWVAQQHHEQYAAPLAPAAPGRRSAPADTETQRILDDVAALDTKREAAADERAPFPVAAISQDRAEG